MKVSGSTLRKSVSVALGAAAVALASCATTIHQAQLSGAGRAQAC